MAGNDRSGPCGGRRVATALSRIGVDRDDEPGGASLGRLRNRLKQPADDGDKPNDQESQGRDQNRGDRQKVYAKASPSNGTDRVTVRRFVDRPPFRFVVGRGFGVSRICWYGSRSFKFAVLALNTTSNRLPSSGIAPTAMSSSTLPNIRAATARGRGSA